MGAISHTFFQTIGQFNKLDEKIILFSGERERQGAKARGFGTAREGGAWRVSAILYSVHMEIGPSGGCKSLVGHKKALQVNRALSF